LISRTISHMRMCKARGTLVIPKWKSAVFWPMIINRFADNYQSYIKDLREYKNSPKKNSNQDRKKTVYLQNSLLIAVY